MILTSVFYFLQLVKLDSKDVKTLNEFHKKPDMHRSLLDYHKNGLVWGWTYEQLGWNMDNEGYVKA